MNKDVQSPDGDSWKELAHKTQGAKAGITVEMMIARMNEVLPFAKASCIFDNGCGSGRIMSYILDTFDSEIPVTARIIAGDFSTHMLEAFDKTKRERTSVGRKVWDRLELLNLDAHDLSTIANDSVSHITAGHLYFLLADPQKALSETRRVLSTDGVLAFSVGSASQHIDALQDAVEHIRPGTHLRLIQERWASEEGVRNELDVAGFVNVETFVVPSEMEYTTHSSVAEMLLIMPVMKDALKSYDEDEKKRLLEQVVENLCKINPAVPGALKGTSIAALARKVGGPS